MRGASRDCGSPRSGQGGRPETGALGELAAAEWLRRCGWQLLERNARTRYGEIDLVARDGAALVFVEVKARRGAGPATAELALESIDPRKRLQVRRLARAWLAEHGGRGAPEIRFDAIGIAIAGGGGVVAIRHITAAF